MAQQRQVPRGSWGLLGNQDIGTYPYQALLSMGMAYNYAYDNKNITTGAAYSSAVNRDLGGRPQL